MSALLIDGRFVAVFPRLVRALGGDVGAAATLQAIHYRARAARGDEWLPLLLSEIADEIGISPDQAQRATRRLRDAGLLLVRGARGEMREWAIDYDEVARLEGDEQARRGGAESRQGSAESRHPRRGIALPSSLLEGVEDREVEERRVRKPVDDDPAFARFWSVYPRKAAKGTARRAWARASSSADADDIIAGAVRYAADPNREPEFTAHPATWLNGERWLDGPLPERSSGGPDVLGVIERAAARDRGEIEG